jgi:hypothetical protein
MASVQLVLTASCDTGAVIGACTFYPTIYSFAMHRTSLHHAACCAGLVRPPKQHGPAPPPPPGTNAHPCTTQQEAPSLRAYIVKVLAAYLSATIISTSALPAAADLGAMVCIRKHFRMERVWPNNSCPCNKATTSWPLEIAKAQGTYECGSTGRITAL